MKGSAKQSTARATVTMDCFVASVLAMTVFDPTPLAMTVSTSQGVSAIVKASSSAKADDPVFQSSCDEIERPRRTGSSGQAGRRQLCEKRQSNHQRRPCESRDL